MKWYVMLFRTVALLSWGWWWTAVTAAAAVPREGTDPVGDRTQFAVIIDAGSSGSRLRIYRWEERESFNVLPMMSEVYNHKVEPGISDFATRLGDLRGYLAELAREAAEHVPEDRVGRTPLYLMATAGMRLLLEPKADAILAEVRETLLDPAVCPFAFEQLQARILSGEEEAVFAWIAVNYLDGYFHSRSGQRRSHGILELGGASTQIAFVPRGMVLAEKFPIRIAGRIFPLYAHSYLYYGQNFAVRWVKEQILRQTPGSSVYQDPCMLKGDSVELVINKESITFHGSGKPEECGNLLLDLVYQVEPYMCFPKPCAVGTVYQPTIQADHPFYALGAFAFPLRTVNASDAEGRFTPAQTRTRSAAFCRQHYDDVKKETGRSGRFLSTECMMGIYMSILFTRGYGFDNHTTQIVSKDDINGQPAEWTLGAAIYEMERKSVFACHASPRASPVTSASPSAQGPLSPLLLIIAVLSLRTFGGIPHTAGNGAFS